MKRKTEYSLCNKIAAVCLVVMLLWLTVSLPFVYRSQQAAHTALSSAAAPFAGTEEDSSNPLSGTEEKAPSTTNLAEEFLHEHAKLDGLHTDFSIVHYCQNDRTYTAFHGELLVPPPNRA